MTYDHVFDTVKKDLGLDEKFFRSYNQYDLDANIGKLLIPGIWQKVCQENGRPKDSEYPIIKSWVSDYQPIIPMHQLASQFNSIYKMGVLSNLYIDFWDEIVRQQFIPTDVNFSPVIISAEVGCMKPDPKIYEIAEEKSGFKGDEILFIDDKPENLAEAARHGWQTFRFEYNNPEESAAKLRAIIS